MSVTFLSPDPPENLFWGKVIAFMEAVAEDLEMEGGWALLLTHDYHHGIDFAAERGVSMVTPMKAITTDNVGQYVETLGDQNWRKIDFRQLSKQYNRSLKQYDFSLDALLNNVARRDNGADAGE